MKTRLLAIMTVFLVCPLAARAQWLTESIVLTNGWNAVFLHVDASHATLDQLVASDGANPIQEVWLWNAPSTTAQFVQDPLQPTGAGSEWTSWDRNAPSSSSLERLPGNAAYLVRVAGVQSYTWRVKGRPVPPAYQWTSSGLNFLGFSTPVAAAPTLQSFLAPAPESLRRAEFYRYTGGALSANNPALIPALLHGYVRVNRGQAFWIGPTNNFNRYAGPFELTLQRSSGVDFEDSAGQHTLRLRNTTSNPLTVTLQLLPSDEPPAGQAPITAIPPLLLRGALNTNNLTHFYTNLPAGSPVTRTLLSANQPGSEVELVLGVNRSQLSGAPGALYAGILRFSDSLGHLQLNIPVSATVASSAGLWVGAASVTNVGHYLLSYQRSVQTNYVEAPNGEPVVQSVTTNLATTADGRYIASNTNTSPGKVARPFPLRLIVHNPASGNPRLLQRVYYGLRDDTNLVVATRESVLDSRRLDSARRMSSAHLPWSPDNQGWLFNGLLQRGASVTAPNVLGHEDASNPFLHTYHPDHDNLNATFDAIEAQGRESYKVTRQITLTLTAPTDDFSGLTADSRTLSGQYSEVVTLGGLGTESRRFTVSGAFVLNRVSDIPTLTQD